MVKCKSKEFRELRKEWYQRLKDEGFKDAERTSTTFSDGRPHDWYRNSYDNTSFFAKEEYFRRASHMLYEYQFKDETERLIWARHSDGLTMREIAEEMRLKSSKRWTKDTVCQVINKIKKHLKG